MEKKGIIYLLIALVSVVYGQDTASYNHAYDDVSIYSSANKIFLGNFGQAHVDVLSPFADNQTYTPTIFRSTSDSLIYTDMYVAIGQPTGGLAKIEHHQPLSKRVMLNLGYFRSSFNGFYNRQLANVADFTSSLSFSSKDEKYEGQLFTRFYSRNNQLNGGIVDSNFNRFYNANNLEIGYPIQLNNATLQDREQIVDYTHQYHLKNDSFSSLSIKQTFNYFANKYRYVDVEDEFYQNYFYDTTMTNDSMKTEFLTHNLVVEAGLNQTKIYGGISNSYADYKANGAFIPSMIHSFLVGGNHTKNNFSVSLNGSYTFLGFLSGNYLFDVKTEYSHPKWLINSFKASALLQERTPDLWYYYYNSNHYQWDLGLTNETKQSLSVSVESTEKLKLKLGANVANTANTVFFDSAFIPKQTGIQWYQVYLTKKFEFTRWLGLESMVAYQNVQSNEPIELPNLYTNNRIYFQGRLLKKVLRFKVGIDVLYYSSYYGKGYNPSLDHFFVQNERLVGGYPFIDGFAEGYIKHNIAFFVKVQHANYGLLGTEYLAAPTYRQQDRIIQLGVKWRLYN